MDYKCISCECEWPEEYLVNMEERMFRGKRTPDLVFIEGSWYHRACAVEGNFELGKIIENREFLICDRCKKEIIGFRHEMMTAGFYDVTGSPWNEFASSDEKNICDECMFANSKFQEIYGIHTP